MKKLPDIKLLLKCYKTINSFSPNIILIQIIKAVTDSLFPFITISHSHREKEPRWKSRI